MLTYVIAALVFLLVVAGMAVGVIFSNREIKGSCGGLANLQGQGADAVCDVCGMPAADSCQLDESEAAIPAATNATTKAPISAHSSGER